MNDFENIASYRHHVARLAKNKSNNLIPNGSNSHAIVLIQNLFLNADNKIRIFSSLLKKEIYEDETIIDGLNFFLNKPGTELEIIIQDYNTDNEGTNLEDNLFYKTCSNSNKCKIHAALEKDRSFKEHFMIMDDVGYRFCPDKDKSSAVASFNRPGIVANLIEQFTILFERSESITAISA